MKYLVMLLVLPTGFFTFQNKQHQKYLVHYSVKLSVIRWSKYDYQFLRYLKIRIRKS